MAYPVAMRFFKRFRTSKPTFSAPLTPDEPFFAIGDIHGRDDLLARLLPLMQDRAPGIRQVFVGDYIDRGEESAQVLRRLHEMQSADPQKVICLKGNHEDMLLNFLDAPARSGPRWMRYGGLQTMASFRVGAASESASEETWNEVRDMLRLAMGGKLETWLRELPTLWQTGNVAVLHAGADPALPLEGQDEQTLVWGHPAFMTTPREDGTWVVHGHTVVDEAASEAGRINTDTGAYATGVLTAAHVTQDEVAFLRA